MARVVILGAGIAGHTAALHLRRWLRREHEVIVISQQANGTGSRQTSGSASDEWMHPSC
ncbi:FAD-dependent oxidoreductase [Mycobacterium sp.]|uniref:FAD-dependent oxidoreductase n=1 Tax=Mycobacterium sp. TaxID=1785 RepID=UPI003BB7F82F